MIVTDDKTKCENHILELNCQEKNTGIKCTDVSVIDFQYIILQKQERYFKKKLSDWLTCYNLIDYYVICCHHVKVLCIDAYCNNDKEYCV